MTTPSYKPLGLTQVCEIRDYVELAIHYATYDPVDSSIARWSDLGFDPGDVRQAAEEALENLRAG